MIFGGVGGHHAHDVATFNKPSTEAGHGSDNSVRQRAIDIGEHRDVQSIHREATGIYGSMTRTAHHIAWQTPPADYIAVGERRH